MIKRLLILTFLVALTVYIGVAIFTFNKPKEGVVCSKVDIVFNDSSANTLISTNDVKAILVKANQYPLGSTMEKVNLSQIKTTLVKSPYIGSVQCYKTVTGKVRINVACLIPILYIISDNGERYFLDSRGETIPQQNMAADLVIATGNISKKYAHKNLTTLGNYIQNNEFWNNQIQQIHVLHNGNIELIPRIGEHTILLGKPQNIENKLSRMKTFYTEGLNKVGWNKYSTISIEYDNQIICTKK